MGSGSFTTVLVTVATDGWYLRVAPEDTVGVFNDTELILEDTADG